MRKKGSKAPLPGTALPGSHGVGGLSVPVTLAGVAKAAQPPPGHAAAAACLLPGVQKDLPEPSIPPLPSSALCNGLSPRARRRGTRGTLTSSVEK